MIRAKILLVNGHTKYRDKGAYSPTLGMTEYEYADLVTKACVKQYPSFEIWHHEIDAYYTRQKTLREYMIGKGFDLALELHFNASDNKNANGTEVLCHHASVDGREYAQLFAENISNDMGTNLRLADNGKGVVYRNRNQRGWHFLNLTPCPALILEPFFGSNVEDSNKFKDIDAYACSLNNSIYQIFK